MELKTNLATPFAAADSAEARQEMLRIGLVDADGRPLAGPAPTPTAALTPRHAVQAPNVLNEAYHYAKPASFSRALSIDLGAQTLLLISGTASVDEHGATIHVGDFRAQLWRTFRNITELLAAEGMTWHNIIRTTCYIRDIERDYEDFNQVRARFYEWLRLDPLPASTAIQARICRSDLLVEIEAMAIRPNQG